MIGHNGILRYYSIIHSNKTVFIKLSATCSELLMQIAYKKHNSLTTIPILEHN